MCAIAVISTVTAHGEVLYHISSFNNNNTTASVYWEPGITTITVATGLTGTDDAGLLSLQNIRANADSATSGVRFRNTEPPQNNVRGTVTADVGNGNQYFQFGISISSPAETIALTSLSFDAVRATTGTTVRGYDIDVSINGGAYVDLGAADIANNRNEGLESFDLPLTSAGATTVDFRVHSTGGGVEYTNFAINGSIIASSDNDGDGLNDLWEDIHFGNADGNATPAELALQSGTDDGFPTPDGDGLDNEGEETNQTDPNLADSDSDGLEDGPEVNGTNDTGVSHGYGATDPLDADSDGDGISDSHEIAGILNIANGNASTDPNNSDSDGDLMDDLYEVTNNLLGGLNPNADDAAGNLDGDPGLAETNTQVTNLDEYNGDTLGVQTRADQLDTDGDGYDDHVEDGEIVAGWFSSSNTGTSPVNPDSDGDGLLDGAENPDAGTPGGPIYNSDPTSTNSDSDSMGDYLEVLNGLNPGLDDDDQDGDGFDNLVEILNGSSPIITGDTPANTNLIAGSEFTLLPWLNTGSGVTPDSSAPLLAGAAECGLLNNNNNNTGAMVSLASPGGVVYYSVDLRFTGTLESEGINILADQTFRVRTSITAYCFIRIQEDGSVISHGGPGASAGTIVAGNTYTCQMVHDITAKTFKAQIFDRTNGDALVYDAPITDTRNQDDLPLGNTINFGAGLQSTNTDAYELCLDNIFVSTAPIVPGSAVTFPSVSGPVITSCLFVNGDLKITFSPGGTGYILTSSDNLVDDFAEETNATYDGTDTFTVPAAALNSGHDFFRVETAP